MITTDAATYREALPEGGRLLGLDVGTKTIGTALCDAGWSFASPAHLIKRTKFTADKADLVTLIAQQQVKGLVIGLPLNLDGSDSPRTQSTRAFARNMADLDLPIFLWDERWSTAAVERAMIAADVSRAKRAERIDSARGKLHPARRDRRDDTRLIRYVVYWLAAANGVAFGLMIVDKRRAEAGALRITEASCSAGASPRHRHHRPRAPQNAQTAFCDADDYAAPSFSALRIVALTWRISSSLIAGCLPTAPL